MTAKEKDAIKKVVGSICNDRTGLSARVRCLLIMDILQDGEKQFREMPNVILGRRLIQPLSMFKDKDKEGGVYVTYRGENGMHKAELSEFPIDDQIFMLRRLVEDITASRYLVVSSWTQADTIYASSKEEAIAKARRKLPSHLQGADIDIDIDAFEL